METKLPETLIEVIRHYSDTDVCRNLLASIRWPNGAVCPKCGQQNISFMEKYGRWHCKDCRRPFSVKQGTVFEDSPLALGIWFSALWLLSNAKNGISSCELSRSLGITQKSAWFVLHRIRLAMEQGSFEKLSGEVELDETYPGGRSKNMHSDRRGAMRAKGFPKPCVFGMKERGGEVRTKVIPDATRDTIQREICQNIEPGSDVYTDSAKGYSGMSTAYNHDTVDHNKGLYAKYKDEKVISTNGIENYWSVLDRCSYGTYIHQSDQHLPRYLAEEDFRYNSRQGTDGERFLKVLGQVTGKRLTYDELITGHLTLLLPK